MMVDISFVNVNSFAADDSDIVITDDINVHSGAQGDTTVRTEDPLR